MCALDATVSIYKPLCNQVKLFKRSAENDDASEIFFKLEKGDIHRVRSIGVLADHQMIRHFYLMFLNK